MDAVKSLALSLVACASLAACVTPAVQPGCFRGHNVPGEIYYPNTTNELFELVAGRWQMKAAGRYYDFDITDLSDLDDIKVEFSSGDVVNVAFDPDFGKLTFTRTLLIDKADGTQVELEQEYTGYLLAYYPGESKLRLAGTFHQVKPQNPPVRLDSGWYATIERVE